MNYRSTKIAATCLVGSILASCASTPNNYRPITKQISFPDLNEVQEASVGEDMLRQGTSTLAKGVVLKEQNNIFNTVLSPGFYPQIGEDKQWTYHSFQIGSGLNGIGAIRVSGGIFGPGAYPQSIAAARDGSKICIKDAMLGQNRCDTEHPFTRTERAVISESNFQQTLIYSGRVGEKVTRLSP